MRVGLFLEPKGIEDLVRTQLGLTPQSKMQLFPGLSFALQQVTRSLFSSFPHKMDVGISADTCPHFTWVGSALSREGLQISEFSHEAPRVPDKSTLFSLVAEDDPLTGRIFDLTQLSEETEKVKSCLIRVSFSKFLRPQSEVPPYSVRVLVISAYLSVVVFGERIKAEVESDRPVDRLTIEKDLAALKKFVEAPEVIETFESGAKEFASLVFQAGDPRIGDRAALIFKDLDGSAVIEELATRLKLKASNEDINRVLETSSLCKWYGSAKFQWLQNQGFSLEEIRGLVVIDQSLCTAQVLGLLKSVVGDLRQISRGTV